MMKAPTVIILEIDHAKTGEKVRSTREKSKMSLRELARRMGVSAPFLCDLEKGRRNWKDETYQEAMRILGK